VPAAPAPRAAATTRMMAFSFPGLGNKDSGGAGVLVVGATGRTGKRIVQVLQSQGKAVTAGVRNVEKGQELLGGKGKGKLAFLQIDVEKDSADELASKLQGFSAVVWYVLIRPVAADDLVDGDILVILHRPFPCARLAAFCLRIASTRDLPHHLLTHKHITLPLYTEPTAPRAFPPPMASTWPGLTRRTTVEPSR
jgi:hypothetical protein